MIESTTLPIRRVRSSIGRALVRLLTKHGYAVQYTRNFFVEIDGDYLDAIYCSGHPVFYIEVEITRQIFSANKSYSRTGWHPYVIELESYAESHSTRVVRGRTLLGRYFDYIEGQLDCLAPATFSDDERQALLKREFTLWPWRSREHDWGRIPMVKAWVKSFRDTDLQNLFDVYNSIRENGYKPSYHDKTGQAHNIHINGHFLRRADEFRFVVLDGNHRAAALSVLGYEKIPVTFAPGYPRVVDIRDVEDWPQVRHNNLSVSTARKIFDHYFDDDGREIAAVFETYTQELPESGT